MNIKDWRTQLRKGILEYCLLLLIKQKDRYGYEMIQSTSMILFQHGLPIVKKVIKRGVFRFILLRGYHQENIIKLL